MTRISSRCSRPLQADAGGMMWTLSPGSLRSPGVICISSRCTRPLRRPKICTLLSTYPRPSSPERLCMLSFIHFEQAATALGEVGGISSEMHVTPAERSEPGDKAITRTLRRPRRGREHLDRDARNPSRAKRAWGYDSSSTFSLLCFEDARERASFQVEVEKYYPSQARFALPGSTIYWTL